MTLRFGCVVSKKAFLFSLLLIVAQVSAQGNQNPANAQTAAANSQAGQQQSGALQQQPDVGQQQSAGPQQQPKVDLETCTVRDRVELPSIAATDPLCVGTLSGTIQVKTDKDGVIFLPIENLGGFKADHVVQYKFGDCFVVLKVNSNGKQLEVIQFNGEMTKLLDTNTRIVLLKDKLAFFNENGNEVLSDDTCKPFSKFDQNDKEFKFTQVVGKDKAPNMFLLFDKYDGDDLTNADIVVIPDLASTSTPSSTSTTTTPPFSTSPTTTGPTTQPTQPTSPPTLPTQPTQPTQPTSQPDSTPGQTSPTPDSASTTSGGGWQSTPGSSGGLSDSTPGSGGSPSIPGSSGGSSDSTPTPGSEASDSTTETLKNATKKSKALKITLYVVLISSIVATVIISVILGIMFFRGRKADKAKTTTGSQKVLQTL